MNHTAWNEIVTSLDSLDIDSAIAAAERLQNESTDDDIPRLVELLKYESFFVREAAAWPLAEIAGPAVLEPLFAAYRRSEEEGHDNDGFSAALIELATLHPDICRSALDKLQSSQDSYVRELSLWLLEFCERPSI
ncbi:HEAT repeat domain-containing protein [Pseudomonas sp. A-1]|nr:HEAT repeat domain-containing protein [Pseudomonas sp. A-1]